MLRSPSGEQKVGVRWHFTAGRLRLERRRLSWANTSREMASHHFAAGTFTEASVGPDIHAQLLPVVISGSPFPPAVSGRFVGGS
jgi:hypothetical protein